MTGPEAGRSFVLRFAGVGGAARQQAEMAFAESREGAGQCQRPCAAHRLASPACSASCRTPDPLVGVSNRHRRGVRAEVRLPASRPSGGAGRRQSVDRWRAMKAAICEAAETERRKIMEVDDADALGADGTYRSMSRAVMRADSWLSERLMQWCAAA